MNENLDIYGGSNTERDAKIDCRKLVNMYVLNTPGGKNKQALATMPGSKTKTSFPELNEVRNLYVYKDYLYAVVNFTIFRIDPSFTATIIGLIDTATGPISIEENQNQLIFIDGSDGYIWDTSTSIFSKITSSGFPTLPVDVAALDGYFIVPQGESNRFYVSALNDGLTWDVLKFALMGSQQDTIVAIAQLYRRVFIFGKKITEVWYDSGDSDFPLRRDNNMLFQYGCLAPDSVALGGIDEDKRLFWIAGDINGIGSIMMSDGSTPKKISTPAVDYAIQNYSHIEDAKGIAYKIDGHTFYELSFTQDNHTWIYDLTTDKWAEGETLDRNRKTWNCHAFFNKVHYIGDYNSSKIREVSSNIYDDDGEAIRRKIISGHFSDKNLKRIHIPRIQLDAVMGTGLENGEYGNVKVMCTANKDNMGFFNKRDGYIGTMGNRANRCIFRRFGTARDWYFDFEIISKNKVMIIGANVDYEVSGR